MPEFLDLTSLPAALDVFLGALSSAAPPPKERLSTSEALGRVLAHEILAPHALPAFPRSTVDGYALRAADSHGASQSLPAYLELAGEVLMGAESEFVLQLGQAALVHTGGMIPDGADAVVMVENTQQSGADEIEVLRAVASGENVLAEGEDVTAGEIVLAAGTRLRAQEIGGLMALGITEIQVRKRPRVGILSTGDEVIPPGATPLPGQIRDVNSYTLSALVTRFGGEPIRRGIVPDTYEALQDAVRQAHREDDVVIVTAGSSVSARDLTARVMQSLGSPGVLVHGIAIKPGKPTILAVADGKPMIGLPGNPVSAVVLASLTLRPLLGRLLGLRGELPSPFIPAALGTNVASLAGREDFLPVRLEHAPGGLVAHPVFGRSNLIFTLVRADGWVHIPPATTGLNAGADVQVYLY